MHDQTLREEMEMFYIYLQQILRSDQLTIPSGDYDLVLDIMPIGDGRISWSYYYACHESRCLFWLETYDASYMLSELYGVKAPAHVSALQLSHSSFPQFPQCSMQSTAWSPFIGKSDIPCWIGVRIAYVHLDRNHWSLFPVVFKGRRFPRGVYDELMGMLVHGCFGELIDPTLVFHEKSSSSIS